MSNQLDNDDMPSVQADCTQLKEELDTGNQFAEQIVKSHKRVVEKHYNEDTKKKAMLRPDYGLEYVLHGPDSAPEKVVMIMGLWTPKEAWAHLVEHLMEKGGDRYQYVTFDNRGIGGSDGGSDAYSTSGMAADTLALTDYLGWEKFHCVGISMGGMISQELAILAPSRIRSLTLIVTTAGFIRRTPVLSPTGLGIFFSTLTTKDPKKLAPRVAKLLYPPSYLDSTNADTGRPMKDHIYPIFEAGRGENNPNVPKEGAVGGQFKAVLRHSVSGTALQELTTCGFPILVIGAGEDVLVHPAQSRHLAKRLRSDHTSVSVYPNAGHGVIDQHRDEVVNDLLGTFEKANVSE